MYKILIVLPNDMMGGAEQYLFEMCQFLSMNNRIKVVFLKKPITHFWNKNIQNNNVELLYLDATTEKRGFIKLLKWSFLNKSNYNYVITSHLHLNGIIGLLRKINLIKIQTHIARESTYIFDRFKGFKLREFKFFYSIGYNNIDLLITQTDSMREKLLLNLSRKQTPKIILTIPNLVNFENIKKKSLAFIPNQKKYIVSAGRLIKEKGFDNLIEGFSLIPKEIGDFILVILGEGNERRNLEKLIKKFDLKGKVKLLGYKNNPMPYFKYADMCVVSSRVEGFPNVLLQMMALNGNVVSTLCTEGIDKLPGIDFCDIDNSILLSNLMINALTDRKSNLDIYKNEIENRSVEKYWSQVKNSLNET